MSETTLDSFSRFINRRISTMLFLGFSSGLPLALTSGTLQAWLTVAGIDIRTIGIFALVGLPYTFKFLWSPLMDRFVPPWLGRRRGWMIISQFCLMVAIGAIAAISPNELLWLLGVLAFMVAFLSASQDIAFDAYRADILRPSERGLGAALSVFGYRVAMLVSGALALITAERIGWQSTYLVMAVLMTVGMVTTFLSLEPEGVAETPKTVTSAIVDPLREFLARRAALSLLLLIVLYKLGDAFAGTLTTAFLIRGLGFSVSEVGVINKGLGLIALLLGALSGGALMVRLRMYQSLLWFGLLQAITNLGFMALAVVGKDHLGMAVVVALENFAGGMGTAAFVALLMALCDHRFTATQFALLSALAAIGRVLVGPASGYLVEAIGWTDFFLLTFFSALPGLGLLWLLKRTVETLNDSQQL
jgi:MFS transporter, PAT family, beta-lactamase induction signal transducer AmpG